MKLVRFAVCVFACLVMSSWSGAAEPDAGFTPIFNGRDLAGWKTAGTEGYKVEDGKLIAYRGTLNTEKHYDNFILRFEFRLPPGGNNGIGVRDAMEIQILDDTAPKHAHIKLWQHHGSIYGVVPAKQGSCKPVGQWNEEEILADGNHIRVTVNGQVVVDADLKEAMQAGPADGKPKKHANIFSQSGPIGLRGHNSRVEFRNLRVKEL